MLSVWVVLAVMPLLSLLNQPVYLAQSAALPRIVDREELVGANSVLVDSVTLAVATVRFLGLNITEAGAGDIEGPEVDGAEDNPTSVGRSGRGSRRPRVCISGRGRR